MCIYICVSAIYIYINYKDIYTLGYPSDRTYVICIYIYRDLQVCLSIYIEGEREKERENKRCCAYAYIYIYI